MSWLPPGPEGPGFRHVPTEVRRRSKGFTLVEVMVAAALVGLLVPTIGFMFSTWRSMFYTGGFAQLGSESVPYAPSYTQRVAADSMIAMMREDDLEAAVVLCVDREIAPGYVGESGRMPQVPNAWRHKLVDQVETRALLQSSGVPFTVNAGFTVIMLRSGGDILALYACNYVDGGGVRRYTARRTTSSATATVSYSFVEPLLKTQPVPAATFSTIAGLGSEPVLQVRFPDPASRLADQINDSAARATAVANLRRSAQNVVTLQSRR
jgi:prepilin-type N-terminal cleavage/methylation domain-containing protein